MKKILLLLALGLTLLLPAFAASKKAEPTPAFPGAEGFARYVSGGRGGVVYHVTTLEDTGDEGSLRYACTRQGARVIVFDVCGNIRLNAPLHITKDSCTIAGQTAPGDGISISDFPVIIRANNVIVRFLRFRLGDRYTERHEGDALTSMDRNDIIIDHCSMSWSIDECCSVYGGQNITVQWCIVSQSLVNAGHSKGPHGYGGNWGGAGATYAHNLICHHKSRTPRFGPRPSTQLRELMDFRNNVIYNWSTEGCYGGEAMDLNIVNNYYKPGPATTGNTSSRIFKPSIRTTQYCEISQWYEDGTPANGNKWIPTWHRWGHFYVEGNINAKHEDVTADNWGLGVVKHISRTGNDGTATEVTLDTIRARKAFDTPYVTTWPADQAYEKVLGYAGCCRVKQGKVTWDVLDSIMISDTRLGVATFTGEAQDSGLINSQFDVRCDLMPQAWPRLMATESEIQRASKDTDGDGIPDYYETAYFGGEVAGNALCKKKGYTQYTNLDYYLARLAEEITVNISPEMKITK